MIVACSANSFHKKVQTKKLKRRGSRGNYVPPHDAEFEKHLDNELDLIGFENGVYDLRTGKLRDGRPEDMISLSTKTNHCQFEEDDEHIVDIFTFMSQVFPDQDTRDYVFTLLASFLEGRNPNEKFHFWTGVGGNGKSKLLELFELALGQYTAEIPSSLLAQKVGGRSPPDEGKFNVGIMKDWTGNDRLTCRPLYGEQFDFKPQLKTLVSCNQLPGLPPDDEGVWRRVSVVDFKSRFVDNPDPSDQCHAHLSEKFESWKDHFMYILLEHYKLYKTNGLVEPQEVGDTINKYRVSVNIYQNFIDDNLEKSKDPDDYVTINHIWCIFRNKYAGIKRKDFVSGITKILGQPIEKTCIKRKFERSVFLNLLFVHSKQENDKIDCEKIGTNLLADN